MDGVSLTVANYARCLTASGHKACVVTPYVPHTVYPTEYPVYAYRSMPLLGRKPYRFGLPYLDFSFRKQIKAVPFTLVHAHCPFSSGMLARKIARQRGIPFVATFHSKYKQDFERVLHNRTVVDAVVHQIVDFYESADEVWIPQPAVEETLRSYGYRGRVEVIDNGTDYLGTLPTQADKARAKVEIGCPSDVPMLLYVGQHIHEKNVALLLQVMKLLEHDRYHLILIGTGYAADELKQMADELKLTQPADNNCPCVTFIGEVKDRNRLRLYYEAADLFTFPSLYDNAPLVVREAAACCTPPLLVRGSTASEFVRQGQNGFLAENDANNYAATIRHLLAQPDTCYHAGLEARRTLARSWEDVAAEVTDRYRHITERYHHQSAIHPQS